HQEVGKVLYNYILSHGWMSSREALVSLFIIVVLVATLVTICIEKPVRSLKKNLLSAIQSRYKPYASDGIVSTGDN
ncbi:MAG TPA: hypothetical protein VKR58_08680, partial [Aquella sp.]|nr:hypothetical protein [Aquella sp.]